MTALVVLDPGCCPAGSADALRAGGPKVVDVRPARGAGVLREDGTTDVDGWAWRVADVVGLHREAVLAGCPVPLADAMTTWARVDDEVRSDRWDVVVLPVPPDQVGELVDAPHVLRRVVDARLDALAPLVADDATVAGQVATLLAGRPALDATVALAATAVTLGAVDAHDRYGCNRPGGLGLALLPVEAVEAAAAGRRRSVPVDVTTLEPQPAVGVRAEGEQLVWWLRVPVGAAPELHHEADRLHVSLAGRRRTLPLPAALLRCEVRGAAVVDDRLEVRFVPDPEAWR